MTMQQRPQPTTLRILKNEAQAPSHKSTTEHGLLIPSLLHQLPKDWNAAKNQEMANMANKLL